MKSKLVLLAAICTVAAAAIPSVASAIVPKIVTCQVTQGTLGISWSGQTATATASGFSVGGGQGQFVYTWSPGGAVGATVDFSSYAAGTPVSYTLNIICDGAVQWTGSYSSTVPSSGSGNGNGNGNGNGGGGSVPVVTLAVSSPNPQAAGNQATITYSATNSATTCQSSGAGVYNGPLPAPSYTNYNIGSVQQTSTITVTCSNVYGTSAGASATITVTGSGGGGGNPDCSQVACPDPGYSAVMGNGITGSGNGQYGAGTWGECDTDAPFGQPPITFYQNYRSPSTISTVKLLFDCYGPIRPTTVIVTLCFVRNGFLGTCQAPLTFAISPLSLTISRYLYPIGHTCISSTTTSWGYYVTMQVTWINGSVTTTAKQSPSVPLPCG